MAPGKRNPHLLDMKEDVLYHIGINSGTQNLKETFGDVKVKVDKNVLQVITQMRVPLRGFSLKLEVQVFGQFHTNLL